MSVFYFKTKRKKKKEKTANIRMILLNAIEW